MSDLGALSPFAIWLTTAPSNSIDLAPAAASEVSDVAEVLPLDLADAATRAVQAACADTRLDELERAILLNLAAAKLETRHLFTPGLYAREMRAPAGSVIVSKIHKTKHPYILSAGRIRVRDNDGEWQILSAPYMGVTEPGTRRVGVVEEDVVWTTLHVTDLTDVDAIEAEIIEPHYEHLKGLVQAPPASEPWQFEPFSEVKGGI